MEEMEDHDQGYTPAPAHRKSLSGNFIARMPTRAITSVAEDSSAHTESHPTTSNCGPADIMALAQPSASRDRRILILGQRASGKSTVGNAILEKNLLPVPSPNANPAGEVKNLFSRKTHKVRGRRVTVVDTQAPSDLGDEASNAVLGDVWLSACSPGPHAFVFVTNLFTYHQMVCQDADQVQRLEEGELQDSRSVLVVDENAQTQQHGVETGLGRYVESGGTENETVQGSVVKTVSGQLENDGKRSPTLELYSIQKYFGQEALKYTVLVFTHADKLKRKTRNDLLNKDPYLKWMIEMLGGNQHFVSSKSWRKKGKAKKLMSIIDEMLLRNGGQHYTAKGENLSTTETRKNKARLTKLLRLPLPLPSSLATIDVSPEGIARFQKMLQKMGIGAFTGTLAGVVCGATLKIVTFFLDQAGPSMIGYAALLIMPLILGGSSDSSSSFSLSGVTGGVILGFILIMTIIGAILGCVRGGNAATTVETYKEAAKIGAWTAYLKEKEALLDSFNAIVQRVRSEPEESPSGGEAGAEENVGEATGELSEVRTESGKVKDVQSTTSEMASQRLDGDSNSNNGKATLEMPTLERREGQRDTGRMNTNNIFIEGIVETMAPPEPGILLPGAANEKFNQSLVAGKQTEDMKDRVTENVPVAYRNPGLSLNDPRGALKKHRASTKV